jgi:hypothetical protein
MSRCDVQRGEGLVEIIPHPPDESLTNSPKGVWGARFVSHVIWMA